MGLYRGSIGEHILYDFCFFSPNLLLYFRRFLGFILFQNGWLRSPDLLQYFLDDFGNFENYVKIWTRRPPHYYQNASTNTNKNYGIILEKICLSTWDSKNRNSSKNVCPRYNVVWFFFFFRFALW